MILERPVLNGGTPFSLNDKNTSKFDKDRLTIDAYDGILSSEVMNMNPSEERRVRTAFAVLRAATVVALLIGTLLAALFAHAGTETLTFALRANDSRLVAGCVVGFVVLLTVSALCWVVLLTFFRMCGRLKTERAFTEINENALRRMARCFAACTAVLAAGALVIRVLVGAIGPAMLWLGIITFLFLFAASVVHALALLVCRAEQLQAESDLTV